MINVQKIGAIYKKEKLSISESGPAEIILLAPPFPEVKTRAKDSGTR